MMIDRDMGLACCPGLPGRLRAASQGQGHRRLRGGQGRNRTADTGIFSPLLYRLSYLAGKKLSIKAILRRAVKLGMGERTAPL